MASYSSSKDEFSARILEKFVSKVLPKKLDNASFGYSLYKGFVYLFDKSGIYRYNTKKNKWTKSNLKWLDEIHEEGHYQFEPHKDYFVSKSYKMKISDVIQSFPDANESASTKEVKKSNDIDFKKLLHDWNLHLYAGLFKTNGYSDVKLWKKIDDKILKNKIRMKNTNDRKSFIKRRDLYFKKKKNVKN